MKSYFSEVSFFDDFGLSFLAGVVVLFSVVEVSGGGVDADLFL